MRTSSTGAEPWTPERVCKAMIEAFRALPTMPVYAPRRTEFVPVLPGQDPSPLQILALSEQVLGRTSPLRRALLVWARSKATGGDIGGSIRGYCRETGTSYPTFMRHRKAACEQVAAEMNRLDDVTAAALKSLSKTEPVIPTQVTRLLSIWDHPRAVRRSSQA